MIRYPLYNIYGPSTGDRNRSCVVLQMAKWGFDIYLLFGKIVAESCKMLTLLGTYAHHLRGKEL